MKDRIRLIRKSLTPKCTQEKFAALLGTTRNALKSYELGTVIPNDTFIKLLCSKFNVNEEWLRTGTGEIYAENDESIVRELIEKYHMTENQQRIMYAFLAMDDEKRERVATAFFDFVDSMRQQESKQSDADIEAELDAYRQELKAEAEARVSSPSAAGNGSSKRGA